MSTPTKEQFATALKELVDVCIHADMHPADMIEALKMQLDWCREVTRNTTHPHNARGATLTEAEIRALLHLGANDSLPR